MNSIHISYFGVTPYDYRLATATVASTVKTFMHVYMYSTVLTVTVQYVLVKLGRRKCIYRLTIFLLRTVEYNTQYLRPSRTLESAVVTMTILYHNNIMIQHSIVLYVIIIKKYVWATYNNVITCHVQQKPFCLKYRITVKYAPPTVYILCHIIQAVVEARPCNLLGWAAHTVW